MSGLNFTVSDLTKKEPGKLFGQSGSLFTIPKNTSTQQFINPLGTNPLIEEHSIENAFAKFSLEIGEVETEDKKIKGEMTEEFINWSRRVNEIYGNYKVVSKTTYEFESENYKMYRDISIIQETTQKMITTQSNLLDELDEIEKGQIDAIKKLEMIENQVDSILRNQESQYGRSIHGGTDERETLYVKSNTIETFLGEISHEISEVEKHFSEPEETESLYGYLDSLLWMESQLVRPI